MIARGGGRRFCAATLPGALLLGALLLGVVPAAGATPASAVRDDDAVATADTLDADDDSREWERAVNAAAQAQAEYEAAEAGVAAALDALADAFSRSTQAERGAEASALRLRESQAARGRLVRTLYAAGGTAFITASVVAAPDPDTALWRVVSDRRLMAAALAADARGVDRQRHEAAQARERQLRAEAAADAAAELLERARSRGLESDRALTRARELLSRLEGERRRRAEERRRAAELAARLAAASARAKAARDAALGGMSAADIPPAYLMDYRTAAQTCPGMHWTLLAAVGQVESGHGRNNGPSSAGAIGPMQFMPRTFAAYAVDGDGDGTTDAWNPTDAIFTAAAYLCASGAGEGEDGVRRALFAYNHADWYVQLVLAARAAIAARHPG